MLEKRKSCLPGVLRLQHLDEESHLGSSVCALQGLKEVVPKERGDDILDGLEFGQRPFSSFPPFLSLPLLLLPGFLCLLSSPQLLLPLLLRHPPLLLSSCWGY